MDKRKDFPLISNLPKGKNKLNISDCNINVGDIVPVSFSLLKDLLSRMQRVIGDNS